MWLFCLPQSLLWPHTNTDACLWGAYVKYKDRTFTVRISGLCKVKKWLFQRKVFFGTFVISGSVEQPTWHFVTRCVIPLETDNSLHIIVVNFKWNPKEKRSVNRTMCRGYHTRGGTLIVATIYLQLIQNRYVIRSFTVLHCSHQHCVQPVASDVKVVGYL